MSIEFRDLMSPTMLSRSLTVCLRYEHGRPIEPDDVVQIPEIGLVELDPRAVYVAAEGVAPVRSGQYLVYNSWLTEHLHLNVHVPAQQVFMMYDGLPDAISGQHKVRGKYHYVKLPNLEGFDSVTEQLIWYAYDMTRFPELIALHTSTAENWAMNYPFTQDQRVLASLAEMLEIADPNDTLGRRNPRRMTLMCFMIQRLIAQAKISIEDVHLPHVERNLLVLANRQDQIVKRCREIRRVAGNALRSGRTTGDAHDPSRWPIEAESWRTLACELQNKVPDRPVCHSLQHTMRNFRAAGEALDHNDLTKAIKNLEIAERMMDLQAEIAPRLLRLRLDLGRITHFNLPHDAHVQSQLRKEIEETRRTLQQGNYDVGLTGALVAQPAIEALLTTLEFLELQRFHKALLYVQRASASM